MDKRSQYWNHVKRYYRANWILHAFLLPGMLFIIIFRYIPMAGILVAFKDYNIVKGVMASPWVGLKNFNYLWKSRDFWRVLKNSLEHYPYVLGIPNASDSGFDAE